MQLARFIPNKRFTILDNLRLKAKSKNDCRMELPKYIYINVNKISRTVLPVFK